MKFCILSCVILLGRWTQLAVAIDDGRVRHSPDADPTVKGSTRPTKGMRNPLSTGLPTPENAIYEMEEGEHRSLRGKKKKGVPCIPCVMVIGGNIRRHPEA